MSDIFKTKGKLKIMRDSIVDEYVTHTMTTRNMKLVQLLSRYIIFNNL